MPDLIEITWNRRALDKQGCDVPLCNHAGHPTLVLQGRCHPGAGFQAYYERLAGDAVALTKIDGS
jgi:hypothetical protein